MKPIELKKENIRVVIHDTSPTGIRYKLRVALGARIKTKDLGHTVLDTSNALYRAGFKYAINPSVEIEGKQTIFYYFFNDVEHAAELGLDESEGVRKFALKWQEQAHREGYPAFQAPYLYVKKKAA
jgi:hypothetical protein